MSRLVSDAAFADMAELVRIVNGDWVGAPERLAKMFTLGKRLAPELARATTIGAPVLTQGGERAA